MSIFSGISIICFAASYAITLALEITRLFFRAGLRMPLIVGFAAAGLLAHSLYLGAEAQRGLPLGAPLSGWYHWCLMSAWVVAAVYLIILAGRPRTAVGLFLLPLVLALIGLARLLPKHETFTTDQAYKLWSMIHGLALLLGTVSVVIGFAAGVMYLVQSYRLKHKLPPRRGFRLPSLEWLQHVNERSLIVSCCLLGAGLISGILLNLIIHGKQTMAVPWTDPVVWTSGILFLWLIIAALFNFAYRPAREGRKVAYLTVASFVFLGLVLGIVLFAPTEHATGKPRGRGSQKQESNVQSSGHTRLPGSMFDVRCSTFDVRSVSCFDIRISNFRAGVVR